MLYLLRGIVIIAIFLFFVVTCFRATRFVRERFGLFASIIFLFGLLSFVGGPVSNKDNKGPNSNTIKTWNFTSEDSLDRNAKSTIDIELEKTLISNYKSGIRYGKDKQGQSHAPISAYSLTTGFSSGTKWKPSAIVVNRTEDNTRFAYHVDGIVEWNLLGATVYSQEKEYQGIAAIE